MADETVHIAELRLRVPGLSVDAARALGEDVVQRVGEQLPSGLSRQRLGALEIRLTVPPDITRAELVERIAARMIGALK